MIVADLLEQLITGLIMPSSLLQVVNSLFQTCYNKLGTSRANTTCWQLVNRFVTICLQTCNNLCVFTRVVASLWKSDLLQLDISRLAASCWNNLRQTCRWNVLTINLQQSCWQLTADLLSSRRSKRCERILMSASWLQDNKPAAHLLQLTRFWLCKQP